MNIKKLSPRQSINKAFLKLKPSINDIDHFQSQLIRLLEQTNANESEEFNKNLISDFLKKTYYDPNYFINTKGRNDLVIHNGKNAKSTVGVIIEVKKPNNHPEMLKIDNLNVNINVKAFQELVLYYLRERITSQNLEIRYLIATNLNEWFIFDANVFEKAFAQNKNLVKQFIDFEAGRLAGKKTDFFYKEIAKPAIAAALTDIEFTYVDIRENNNTGTLIALFKLFSPEHLLKLPFANDSNHLNKSFYSELLHIIGLAESKKGSKKLIERQKDGERHSGSLLENTIIQLDSTDKISRLANPTLFGDTDQAQLFNLGLELVITWINRILFLKLLEAQLVSYHKGDNSSYSFLNMAKIKNFGAINSLFFQVLARKKEDRNPEIHPAFAKIPYLNSSLFEPTEIEHTTLFISNLNSDNKLPIFSATVLKDDKGKKRIGELNTLEYLFEFLDAYDFANDGDGNKSLINASVLGLIFEKINGYKDGSFFTPGFITMYMCRQTIRRSVVQKFNDCKGWACKSLDDIYDKIENRQQANEIINSLKICDPAVGSGHFLVSALNEIIAIKNDLKILQDGAGKRLKEYSVEVVNDELIITDEDGQIFEYHPKSKESQRLQVALFHEKQTIIENCLFGVDINSNSVKICRLRLWIELLKNAYYKSDNELETLPNIDINIKCGNSLISRFALDADLSQALKTSQWSIESYQNAVATYRNAASKGQKREMEQLIADIKGGFQIEISNNDPKVRRLDSLRAELHNLLNQQILFEATAKDKKAKALQQKKLEKEINKLSGEIDDIKSNRIYDNAFEWRFEFPEVLSDAGDFVGFDVVIGNPPYSLVFDQSYKKYLGLKYPEFKRNNDIFVAFISKSFNLLNEFGEFSFITPNTFIKGNYFQTLRAFLSKNYQINEIIDFGTKLIFEEANVFTAISSISKNKNRPCQDWVMKTDLDNIKGLIECDSDSVDYIVKNDLIKKLDKLDKFESYFLIKDVGFNYWTEGRGKIRGLSIGSRVFYKGEPENSLDISYIKGSDLNKYHLGYSNNYLRHNWKDYLNENDTFRFSAELLETQPKIIYRQTSNKLIGTLDFEKNYNDKTVHIIVNNDQNDFDLKYVLGLFNSKLLNYFFTSLKEEEGRAFSQVKTVDIKNLPFVKADKLVMGKICENVAQILTAKKRNPKADTTALKTEIDQMVYQLYGLTRDEIAMV